jgi:hypothetical protein
MSSSSLPLRLPGVYRDSFSLLYLERYCPKESIAFRGCSTTGLDLILKQYTNVVFQYPVIYHSLSIFLGLLQMCETLS